MKKNKSYLCQLPLKDKNSPLPTYGIGKLSTNLKPRQLSGVIQLFEGIDETEIQRPKGKAMY